VSSRKKLGNQINLSSGIGDDFEVLGRDDEVRFLLVWELNLEEHLEEAKKHLAMLQ